MKGGHRRSMEDTIASLTDKQWDELEASQELHRRLREEAMAALPPWQPPGHVRFRALPMLDLERLAANVGPPMRAIVGAPHGVYCLYCDSKLRPWRTGEGPCLERVYGRDKRTILMDQEDRGAVLGALVWDRVLNTQGMAAALEAVRDFGPWWAEAYGGEVLTPAP